MLEENEGAVRLYERAAFTAVARSPVVPHEPIPFKGDMLMMMRPV